MTALSDKYCQERGISKDELKKALKVQFKRDALYQTLEFFEYTNPNTLLGNESMSNHMISSTLSKRRKVFESVEKELTIETMPKTFISFSRIAGSTETPISNEQIYRLAFECGLERYSLLEGKLVRFSRKSWMNRKRGVLILMESDYKDWFEKSNKKHSF